jgi:hypothetical protein
LVKRVPRATKTRPEERPRKEVRLWSRTPREPLDAQPFRLAEIAVEEVRDRQGEVVIGGVKHRDIHHADSVVGFASRGAADT